MKEPQCVRKETYPMDGVSVNLCKFGLEIGWIHPTLANLGPCSRCHEQTFAPVSSTESGWRIRRSILVSLLNLFHPKSCFIQICFIALISLFIRKQCLLYSKPASKMEETKLLELLKLLQQDCGSFKVQTIFQVPFYLFRNEYRCTLADDDVNGKVTHMRFLHSVPHWPVKWDSLARNILVIWIDMIVFKVIFLEPQKTYIVNHHAFINISPYLPGSVPQTSPNERQCRSFSAEAPRIR